MRAQHQAAAHRGRAATATTRVEAGLDAQRTHQPPVPRSFDTHGEKAATLAADGTVGGRTH